MNVMVEGTATGAASDLQGGYTILNLQPGIYSLRFRMMGYQEVVIQNVRVSIDLTTRANAAMKPTVVETGEAVTVVAERPLVQVDMTSSLSTVGADEIEDLPVQNIEDVLALQAGVVRTAAMSTSGADGRARWPTGSTASASPTCSTAAPASRSRTTPSRNCR